MAKFPPITKKTYDVAKILQKGGADRKEIAEYLMISISTVDRILHSDDFDDYIAEKKARAYAAKKFAEEKKAAAEKQEAEEKKEDKADAVQQELQVVEHIHRHEQSVTVVANHYMAEQLQKQTELLNLINNKLGAIIDDLYGTGTKKEG